VRLSNNKRRHQADGTASPFRYAICRFPSGASAGQHFIRALTRSDVDLRTHTQPNQANKSVPLKPPLKQLNGRQAHAYLILNATD